MAEIGLTEVSATSMDIVAALVQQTLKQQAKLLPTITDYSGFAVKGAKSVKVPRRDQFSAANKAENTDLTAQEITFAVDTISLDKNKAIYAKLERIAELQATPNVEAEIIQEMAAELALQMDNDIYTELKLASAAAPDHRIAFVGATMARADILDARRLLQVQNVPLEGVTMAINPLHESELLDISDFIDASKYGSAMPIQNGEIGRIYGIPVIMSNVVSDNNVVMYHKSAVGFAAQMQPEYDTDKDLKSTSKEYLLNWVYGAEVLDSGKRQVLIGTAV